MMFHPFRDKTMQYDSMNTFAPAVPRRGPGVIASGAKHY